MEVASGTLRVKVLMGLQDIGQVPSISLIHLSTGKERTNFDNSIGLPDLCSKNHPLHVSYAKLLGAKCIL
jgi:hypothetical protein